MFDGTTDNTLRKIVLKFRILLFLYWALSSSFLCFYVIYLETQKKFPVSEIGIIISLYTLSAIAGLYILGFLCDKSRTIKKVLLPVIFIIGLMVFMFPYGSHKLLIYASIVIIGFLQQPAGAIADSWLMKHLGKHNSEKSYGKIRAFGSLGWALTALLTALMMHNIHWNAMFLICSTAAVLLIISAFFIPDIRSSEQSKEETTHLSQTQKEITFSKAFKELLNNRKFVVIILILLVYFIGEQTFYNFLGLIIKERGGHLIIIGLTYFLAASFEIPSMFISSGLLKKYPPIKLMILGVFINLLRYGFILYFRTPLSITLAYMLEGFSFGIIFTAYRCYVYTIAPRELQTMAYTIGDAVTISFSLIIGALIGGFIIEFFGIVFLTICCTTCCVTALVLLTASTLLSKAENRQ
jgi:PPP family 3-phenylpropionic acid transporter